MKISSSTNGASGHPQRVSWRLRIKFDMDLKCLNKGLFELEYSIEIAYYSY